MERVRLLYEGLRRREGNNALHLVHRFHPHTAPGQPVLPPAVCVHITTSLQNLLKANALA